MEDLMTIKQASEWATRHIGKTVTPSNISYLIQYGRIRKLGGGAQTQISQNELKRYYESYNGSREVSFRRQLRNTFLRK